MIIFVYDYADPLTTTVQTILRSMNTVVADISFFSDNGEYDNALLPFGPYKEPDIWLIADAHLPLTPTILQKKGRKLGFIRNLQPLSYDASDFDILFVFSKFGKEMFSRLYPELSSKLRLCRIPIEPQHFQIYYSQKRQTRELVFIQPFTPESLHILEIYFGEILLQEDFLVTHLFSKTQQELTLGEAEICLMNEGQKRGMEFIFSSSREQYYNRLAQAGKLITFQWTNCVSHLLAAVALGTSIVAPEYGPYPEFFPRENLFSPFNLDNALVQIANPLNEKPAWKDYLPEFITPDYSELAELLRCFI